MSGYVRIHRTLAGHPAFRNDAEAMAFAWLVMKAAWKPTRVRYKERAINLDRGQLAISQRDMATALDRDKAWVERLWKRLRAEAMIGVDSEAGVAVITICNYGNYQTDPTKREAADEALHEAEARQGQGTEQVREEVKKEEETAAQSLRAAPVSVSSAVEFWNEVAAIAGWPLAVRNSEKRRRSVGCRLREHGIDGWRAAIIRARASPYLGGSDPPHWFTVDWIAKPDNFNKLIEGNYDRTRQGSGGSTSAAWNLLNAQLAPGDTASGERGIAGLPDVGFA